MKQHVFLVLYCFFVKLDFPGGREAWSKNHGNSRGWGGGSYNHPLEWKFQGSWGYKIKNPPWERYGYFLEPHNIYQKDICICQNGLSLTYLENSLASSRRATTPLPLSSEPNDKLYKYKFLKMVKTIMLCQNENNLILKIFYLFIYLFSFTMYSVQQEQ